MRRLRWDDELHQLHLLRPGRQRKRRVSRPAGWMQQEPCNRAQSGCTDWRSSACDARLQADLKSSMASSGRARGSQSSRLPLLRLPPRLCNSGTGRLRCDEPTTEARGGARRRWRQPRGMARSDVFTWSVRVVTLARVTTVTNGAPAHGQPSGTGARPTPHGARGQSISAVAHTRHRRRNVMVKESAAMTGR